jgi:hypothetical protein
MRILGLPLSRGVTRQLGAVAPRASSPVAQTSTRYPGTVSAPALGGDTWNDVTNMAADDNALATCDVSSSGNSDIVTLTNFGFSIPVGATVNGITVEIERKASSGAQCRDTVVRLMKSGATGSNKAVASNWPTSLTVATYGGAADLWTLTLTPAEVNDSAFGLDFRVADNLLNNIASVDFIRIKVHYTA